MSIPIYGFYHVATLGHWQAVVDEQLALLESSGLAAATAGLYGTVLGDGWDPRLAAPGRSFQRDPDLHLYEFPTLLQLWERAQEEEFHAYYLHTKGVSRPAHGQITDWRHLMEHFTIDRWPEAVAKLDEGFDTVGCNPGWFKNWHDQPFHYSGNMWWASATHIRRLRPVRDLNWSHPFEAEAWIGWVDPPPRYYACYTSNVAHYSTLFPPELYRGRGYD